MAKLICMLVMAPLVSWGAPKGDYIVKLKKGAVGEMSFRALNQESQIESLGLNMYRVQVEESQAESTFRSFNHNPAVEYIQPNYRIYPIGTAGLTANAKNLTLRLENMLQPSRDPSLPTGPIQTNMGPDPMLNQQWGMTAINAPQAWQQNINAENIVVAVIDTGVDYTHPDLVNNMWSNPGEIPNNGIDDDGNGFVDDVVGWDFVQNDNKPYDVHFTGMFDIMLGGNPGHGTHCAGNVGAIGNNSVGISGVAPNVKIMAMRFIAEKDGGTSANAIKSINYAINNGAKVLSNSWGSVGEDPKDPVGNRALREAVQYAAANDVLFVAAAGNGNPQNGIGYDNDTSNVPAYPASYDMDIILSVAATDVRGNLGRFSNFGQRSVDIGAPGVDIFSTVPGGRWTNVVLKTQGQTFTWDGTSMATPMVAGAAALIWAKYPNLTALEVKQKLMSSSQPLSSLAGKTVSGGLLDVDAALR